MTVFRPRAESAAPSNSAFESPEQEIERLRAQVQDLTARLADAEALADRDTLTPVLNRRAFMREVQRAIAMARRHNVPASVIYFDLDDFKAVNDRHGHAAGDAALVAMAARLLGGVRESDVIGRLGGDDQEAARLKAEALSALVAGQPVRFASVAFSIAATYGVREIQGADSPEQALAEADAVMYLRKPPKGR
jgi:diguanylate cyclase (GGDEF)-like protein